MFVRVRLGCDPVKKDIVQGAHSFIYYWGERGDRYPVINGKQNGRHVGYGGFFTVYLRILLTLLPHRSPIPVAKINSCLLDMNDTEAKQ